MNGRALHERRQVSALRLCKLAERLRDGTFLYVDLLPGHGLEVLRRGSEHLEGNGLARGKGGRTESRRVREGGSAERILMVAEAPPLVRDLDRPGPEQHG